MTLLKAKSTSTPSHNKAIADVLDKVQAETEVPFQVRLSESLAKRVKVYSAQTNKSHKMIATEALEAFLKGRG
jgi:predicted DNA-binding protein